MLISFRIFVNVRKIQTTTNGCEYLDTNCSDIRHKILHHEKNNTIPLPKFFNGLKFDCGTMVQFRINKVKCCASFNFCKKVDEVARLIYDTKKRWRNFSIDSAFYSRPTVQVINLNTAKAMNRMLALLGKNDLE